MIHFLSILYLQSYIMDMRVSYYNSSKLFLSEGRLYYENIGDKMNSRKGYGAF